MAAFLPQHENFFNKVFTDEESDEEFDGFVPEDLPNSSDEEDDEKLVGFIAN